jgi:predicted hydrocarbon binding protein
LNDSETLEAGLVLAGFDALRQIEGGAVLRAIMDQALVPALVDAQSQASRVPIVDYLRYRDAALDYLGESFHAVAFEAGRTLVRNLRHKRLEEVQALIARFRGAGSPLPLIGQAAVLAARGSPGVVRADMTDGAHLSIVIEQCPECRDLQRATPFCFLNQGIVTEFAQRHLGAAVATRETACMAQGAAACQIEVTLAAGGER